MPIIAPVLSYRTLRRLAAAALLVLGAAQASAKTAIVLNTDDDSLSVIVGDTYR